MAGGKLILAAKATRGDGYGNSKNLVRKPRKGKPKTKTAPASSFIKAYNMLLPSKFLKLDMAGLLLSSSIAASPKECAKAYQLDLIAQGNQANERLGNAVHISYLHLYGMIHSESATESKACRLIVFQEINRGGYDTVDHSVLFISLTGAGSQPLTGTAKDGCFRLNRNYVRPIFDKVYKFEVDSGNDTVSINKRIRINRKQFYPLINGTTYDPMNGRLYFVILAFETDQTTTANKFLEVSLQGVVYFKDYRKTYSKNR